MPKVENLVPIHLNAANIPSQQCKSCHNVLSETSLKAEIKPPHKVHLESPFLKFECSTCHKKVDLAEVSGATIRKQVDAALCANCHSSFSTVKMDLAFKSQDCTTCHPNWKDRMMNATYVDNAAITKETCLKCHGGASWFVGGK